MDEFLDAFETHDHDKNMWRVKGFAIQEWFIFRHMLANENHVLAKFHLNDLSFVLDFTFEAYAPFIHPNSTEFGRLDK